MTFEEFFKKKKIDLDAFEKGNPALLFEFKNHFEKMGEKSFDHTKKYWFNKLRLQYHLAPEIKVDKVKMENPLAEQTIADSLAASTAPETQPAAASGSQTAQIAEGANTEHTQEKHAAPKPAFTPRFKPGVTKTAEPSTGPLAERAASEPANEKPKGFTPRFKAGLTKTAEESTSSAPTVDKPVETAAEKPKGFTPRFKAGVTKAAEDNTSSSPNESNPAESAADKPKGFTPRFKAGVTKPTVDTPAQPNENKPEETTADKPKPGFTPRFKAGVTKSAEAASEPTPQDAKTEEPPTESKPKIGFTPRFKAASPPKQQDPPTEDQ